MNEYLCIGDVHGCYDELVELLEQLPKRKIIFVGDLVDRGPDSASTLGLVMHMCKSGEALCVMGNHDWKLWRFLKSKYDKSASVPQVGHSLQKTIEQIHSRGEVFVAEVFSFLGNLPTILELDDLIVVHGAYDRELKGGKARDFNLYGETDGTKGKDGYPKRLTEWKKRYTGLKTIVVGHDPLYETDKRFNESFFETPSGAHIWNIDWGSCFGGELCCLMLPEEEIVTVRAKAVYHKNKTTYGSK